MKRLTIFALALILGGGLWTDSRAQEDSAPTEDVIVDENGDGLDDGKVRRHRRGRFGHRGNRGLGGLTDEQKTELKATITELKDGGATSAEIRAAIDEFRGDNGLLTSDQRGELKEIVSGLRESGTTPEEVVDAITQFHADNGVELSEAQQTRIAEGAERAALRAELHETMTGLKDAGASREEIRAAVEQFATDNGIEKPAGKQGRKGMRGQRGGKGGFGGELHLSDAQKDQVKALRETQREKMQALRNSGERPSRETVQALREEFRANFEAILTPEQLEKLAARKAERQADGTTSSSALQVAPATAVEEKTWGEVKKDTQD